MVFRGGFALFFMVFLVGCPEPAGDETPGPRVADGPAVEDAGESDGSGDGATDGTVSRDAGESDGAGDGLSAEDAGGFDGFDAGATPGSITPDGGSADGFSDGLIYLDSGPDAGSGENDEIDAGLGDGERIDSGPDAGLAEADEIDAGFGDGGEFDAGLQCPVCAEGMLLDPIDCSCTETNECAASPCQNGGVCTDAINAYQCCCPAGYSGVDCSIDIDECASNNGGCEGDCIDSADDPQDDIENFYACVCDVWYRWDVSRLACVLSFPCTEDSCPPNWECVENFCQATACASNDDCADNQQCVNRSCVNPSPCVHAWYCANQMDRPLCSFEDTVEGEDSGRCVGCRGDDDCENPEPVCWENQCVKPCDTSSDCDGQVCHAQTGKCMPCATDSECGNGICQSNTGKCVDCLGPANCGGCERCVAHTCVPFIPCTSADECADPDLLCHPTLGQCRQCLNDAHCEPDEHCGDGVCVMDVCSPGDTACDGSAALMCMSNGGGWENPSNCASGFCADGACEALTCDDDIQNGNETAVDCGGHICDPCDNDLACFINADCKSNRCQNEICQPVCAAVEFPGPVLFDGLYYDQISRSAARRGLANQLDQGALTQAYNASVGNEVLYYIYNGGPDFHVDLQYTASDIEDLSDWMDNNLNIPQDYAGLIVLDMEGVWWDWIYNSSSQAQLDVVIDFYIEGLELAQALRPHAKFGYWGLPLKGRSSPSETPSIKRLLMAQGAVFPDTYEWAPGINSYGWIKTHIENTIALVEGTVPVYPQMSSRWKRSKTDCLAGQECMPSLCGLHAIDEVLSDQAGAILDAEWQAPDGTTCKSAGLAVWDAFIFEKYCSTNQDPVAYGTCGCGDDTTCEATCSCRPAGDPTYSDGLMCNADNFCVELQYTSGEHCSADCGEGCTGKKFCIDRYGSGAQCLDPWWRFTALINCCKAALAIDPGATNEPCCQEVASAWNALDEYHQSLHQALTGLVQAHQPGAIP